VARVPVLVGVDGSPSSDAAVLWAAAEARSGEAELLVVHAVDSTSMGLWLTNEAIRRELRALAQPIVDHAVRLARDQVPDVPVHGQVLIGAPARALVLMSARADLTVLGRNGRGALAAAWLGSTTRKVLARGHGTVVTVPAPRGAQRVASGPWLSRVVVAVEGSDQDAAPVEFSLALAQRDRTPLVVIHVAAGAGDGPGLWTAERIDAEIVAPAAERYPGVPVTALVRSGPVGPTLTSACCAADLLVLGQHRRAALTPPHVGRTISSVLQDAPCAVAVVSADGSSPDSS
jgi:nucleotide-binding universal stress UspA family protein